MPRQPIPHDLPPLDQAIKSFAGFRSGDHRANVVARHLHRLTKRFRTQQSRTFYSVRETAAFFGISLDTAAQVYKQLDREGVLRRVRGSRTYIPARRQQPRLPVKGVVVVPVWLPGFLSFHDWRQFYQDFENELRRRDFVADLLFYHQDETLDPTFAGRMLTHHPDLVAWLFPAPAYRPCLDRLADAGVPVFGFWNHPARNDVTGVMLDNQPAWQQALSDWCSAGIGRVRLPERDFNPPPLPPALVHTLDEGALDWEMFPYQQLSFAEHVAALTAAGDDTGIWFYDDFWCDRLCLTCAEAMADLFQQRRVLVSHPLELLPALVADVRVDLIDYNWKRIAQSAAKIIAGDDPLPRPPAPMFRARYQPRVRAADLAAHFRAA